MQLHRIIEKNNHEMKIHLLRDIPGTNTVLFQDTFLRDTMLHSTTSRLHVSLFGRDIEKE